MDWGGGVIDDNAQAQKVVIRNNVCSQNLTFQIAVAADVPPASVLVDHNLIDGYRGYVDLDGHSRPLDGDYNGPALPDIGADELAP